MKKSKARCLILNFKKGTGHLFFANTPLSTNGQEQKKDHLLRTRSTSNMKNITNMYSQCTPSLLSEHGEA